MAIFKDIPDIKYEGSKSTNPLAFKYYNPDQIVMGKTMKEHLPFAMAWCTILRNRHRYVRTASRTKASVLR